MTRVLKGDSVAATSTAQARTAEASTAEGSTTEGSTTSRRDFLRAGMLVGGGLLLGIHIPRSARADGVRSANGHDASDQSFMPNAWVRIGTDGIVTVILAKSEMGQGVATSLPMLVAEELEADWSKVRFESSPATAAYADPNSGMQMTGGSSSVSSSWMPLREAGAAAREMLVAAAAAKWSVDPSTCRASLGMVEHSASGRKVAYGDLVVAAAALPVPKEPRLKEPKDFRIIGTRTKRLDATDKVNGRAKFGIDVQVPGALTAVVVRPPVFGATVARFDATAARAIKGVRHVLQIDSGIAVVGDGYWPATQGRRALTVEWNEGTNATRSSASISALMRDAAKKGGLVVRNDGNAKEQLASATHRVEAEYDAPFIAHAMMEPGNCVADVRADHCELWAPTQWQSKAREVASKISGVSEDKVIIHTTFLGGGFGRKVEMDFISDAVSISKKVGVPVKVIYSREDDIQHDFYRTAAYNKIAAGLDANGWPVAWTNVVVSDSSLKRMLPQFVGKDGLDPDAIDGAANIPYNIPNVHVEFVPTDLGVPVGAWRSVGGSQNAYIRECFVDELAAAAKKDPIAFRKHLLTDKRHVGVLDLVAEKSGWGKPLPAGHF
ncbi:MAG: molybdopterin cofactor-binding domain-containing protein, partial [Gemmatimonadaceae bacterium]